MLRGPIAAALQAAPMVARDAGIAAVRAAAAEHVVDGEVRFPAAVWMAAARRPG
jgi:hypothetical protein